LRTQFVQISIHIRAKARKLALYGNQARLANAKYLGNSIVFDRFGFFYFFVVPCLSMVHQMGFIKMLLLLSSTYKKLQIEPLLISAVILLVIHWIVGASFSTLFLSLGCGSFVLLYGLYSGFLDGLIPVSRHQLFRKQGTAAILLFSFTALFLFYSLDLFSLPAHAQFFFNAEAKVKSYFSPAGLGGLSTSSTGVGTGTANDKVVGLIFNVLRFAFIAYLGYGLVTAVSKYFEQEDWKVVIKAPLIVFFIALIGDFLSGVIVGTGASTPAPTP
jgi:hypothetical protein